MINNFASLNIKNQTISDLICSISPVRKLKNIKCTELKCLPTNNLKISETSLNENKSLLFEAQILSKNVNEIRSHSTLNHILDTRNKYIYLSTEFGLASITGTGVTLEFIGDFAFKHTSNQLMRYAAPSFSGVTTVFNGLYHSVWNCDLWNGVPKIATGGFLIAAGPFVSKYYIAEDCISVASFAYSTFFDMDKFYDVKLNSKNDAYEILQVDMSKDIISGQEILDNYNQLIRQIDDYKLKHSFFERAKNTFFPFEKLKELAEISKTIIYADRHIDKFDEEKNYDALFLKYEKYVDKFVQN